MPSKRIIGLLLICAITLGSLFWVVHRNSPKKEKTPLSVASNPQPIDTKDTDGDGLADWEEALWNTNPSKSDSDNDGRSDSTEVAAGENPSQPGPGNQNISSNTGVQTSDGNTIASGENPNNLTSQIARTVFQRYAEQRERGGVQEIDYNNLLGDVLEGRNGYITENVYTAANVKAVEANPTTLRTYGNAFAQIITQFQELYRLEIQQHFKLSIHDETISANTPVFKEAASKYGTIVSQLLVLQVPRSLVIKHLEAVNNLASIGQSLIDMGNIENDTVRGVRGMERYISLWTAQQVIYRDMASLFTNNGIIFSTSEAGNAWNAFR